MIDLLDIDYKNVAITKKMSSLIYGGSTFALMGTSVGSLLDPNFSLDYRAFVILFWISFFYDQGADLLQYHVVDKELGKIYNEIVDDLVKLSLSLDNKEVMEHFALLSYAHEHYYIACDKSDMLYHDAKEFKTHREYLCLNHHGVCRHASFLAYDFFNRLNFETDILTGRLINGFETFLFDNRMLFSNLNGPWLKDINDDLYVDFILSQRPLKDKQMNHVITQVNDKNYSYYLDILNVLFFTSFNKVFCNNPNSSFWIRDAKLCNEWRKNNNIEKIAKMNSLKFSELYNKMLISTDKVVNNLDLLEKFKNDNKDKLEVAEDIYQKCLKNKKKLKRKELI